MGEEERHRRGTAVQGHRGVVGGWIDPKGGFFYRLLHKRRFHYLRYKGNLHVLALAPTRSGKGVCLVVPTLVTWMESAVISDLKGELYQMTAGWREKYGNQRVLRFEPAALTGSVRWNPLDEIRLEPEYEIADVQNLAGMLTDPDGKGQDGRADTGLFRRSRFWWV